MNSTSNNLTLVWIPKCSRCGDSHDGLPFARLTNAVATEGEKDLTHWAICPTNGEPVLMRITDEGRL